MEKSDEAARFQAALAMADLGVELMRQTLHRRHPGDSEEEIEARLRRWRTGRPMDAVGGPGPPSGP
ncbi:MAG: hypothetical protein ACRDZW_10600 [Acidimicrobiales bacterium]